MDDYTLRTNYSDRGLNRYRPLWSKNEKKTEKKKKLKYVVDIRIPRPTQNSRGQERTSIQLVCAFHRSFPTVDLELQVPASRSGQ